MTRRFDKHLWLCLLVVSIVLIPRSWLIMRSHNETLDTDYHLRHGLAVLLGTRDQFIMAANDPPLGQMILALPMVLTGNTPGRPIEMSNWPADVSVPGETATSPQRAQFERTIRNGVLYGNRWSPPALLELLAVWKAILFIPAMLVIFVWCRAVYGLASAWLAQLLILADPTFAAHIPIAALDTLAVEAIVIACFCVWRYFERQTPVNLALAAVFTVVAMLIKHTAVITPAVFLLFAVRYWRRDWRRRIRPRLNMIAKSIFIGLLAMWALLLFDFSAPADQFRGFTLPQLPQTLDNALHRRWPCGTYIGCFVSGLLTNTGGQRALLFGGINPAGWWYYFPALMTLKVPIGAWVVLLLALVSLIRRPIRPGEFSILIPLIAWVILLMFARVNYGFRHFLPAYAFVLMWSSRCVAEAPRALTITTFACALAALIHGTIFHPNYLSYVNFPRHRVWMQMTDSNLDWDQSTRQIAAWLDKHLGRDAHVLTRSGRAGYVAPYYLRDRVRFLERGKPPPTSGILIISPVWVAGVYDEPGENPYEFLQSRDPIDTIGRSMLVYNLDRR